MFNNVHFVLSSNRMLQLHKRRKRVMDADESAFRAWEPVDDKKCGPHPRLIQKWLRLKLIVFPKKIISDLPLAPICTLRSGSFRINGHKIQLFLPYFNIQTCEQTRVCYICSRLFFKKTKFILHQIIR